MEVFQNESCQIEISEGDLYNPRTQKLLESEMRMEAFQNETRQVGVVSPEVLLAEDGMSFLKGMLSGRHPCAPYSDTMDIDLVEVEEGASSSLARRRYFTSILSVRSMAAGRRRF